jgi:hypothetical protein
MLFRLGAAAAAAALAISVFPGVATAATPGSPDGPVINHNGDWYLRTTPSGGIAEQKFHYGQAGDLGLMGDWNGDGHETVGVARFRNNGSMYWYLRNSNSAGNADITFPFGSRTIISGDVLGTSAVAGNFDPDDDAAEIAEVYPDGPNGTLHWAIRRNLTADSGTVVFAFGRAGDRPVVGDWDGDGVDTVGVVRGNTWYLSNQVLGGGSATVVLNFGSGRDRPIVGDWNGDGVDTPGIVRDAPGSKAGSYQLWLLRNSNTSGNANATFTFGSAAFAEDFPIETNPRLTIQTN